MEVKIFHISDGSDTDTIVAHSKEEAIAWYLDDTGYEESDIVSIEEIPESEWDTKTATFYVDNDIEGESFEVPYRELIEENSIPDKVASTAWPD